MDRTSRASWQTLDAFLSGNPREFSIQDTDRYVSYSLFDLYPEWQDQAHCRGVGVNYYFGDEEQQPTMSIKQVRQAAKLCDVCPVAIDCLRWALTKREEYGVWAGTSGRVRRKIFAALDKGLVTVDDVIEVYKNGKAGFNGLGVQEDSAEGSQEATTRPGRSGGLPCSSDLQVDGRRALNG